MTNIENGRSFSGRLDSHGFSLAWATLALSAEERLNQEVMNQAYLMVKKSHQSSLAPVFDPLLYPLARASCS